MRGFARAWQLGLLVLALFATIFLAAAIFISVSAGNRDGAPARTYQLQAGPYALELRLYRDPPQAGLALPFALAPVGTVNGELHYTVTSRPGYRVDATPVNASFSPDPATPNGIAGTAEIPVAGDWNMQIQVDGPDGSGSAIVPISAVAPPPVPGWLGWLIGLVPAVGLLLFLLAQSGRRMEEDAQAA